MVGQPRQSERKDERDGRKRSRNVDLARSPDKHGHHETSNEQRCNQETKSNAGDLDDRQHGDGFPLSQALDDGQNHQSNHVVEDRRAQDDLALGRLQAAKVGKHPGCDSNARRG